VSKIIELTISPSGETKLETKGFGGQSCRDASKFLEEALGVKTSEQPTAEYYREAESETVQTRPHS
jgi:hypothetical protein